MRVLKDDICNTNVVSQELFEKNFKYIYWKQCNFELSHLEKGSVESSKAILEATLKIGKHSYKSNWLEANCRYNVLLGMTWDVAHNLSINYENRIVKVCGNELGTDSNDEVKAKILNKSLKKISNMMKERRSDVKVFRRVPKTKLETKCGMAKEIPKYWNPGLREMLTRFSTLFREELSPGFLPKRAIDHEIETGKGAKPPHRPLYQLLPIELKAMKIYVQELLDNVNIRPSKSPYGALSFFVKEKDNPSRCVVDYRGLNRITKETMPLGLVQM